MDEHKDDANMDMPFSIGHGQTISQPSLVLNMTLHLELEDDSKVLEIGTGSGSRPPFWQNSQKTSTQLKG